MNFFIYPTKDSSVYKKSSLRELNFGRSEILELTNTFSEETDHNLSRILMEFDIPIDKNNYIDYPDLKISLELKITQSEDISVGLATGV